MVTMLQDVVTAERARGAGAGRPRRGRRQDRHDQRVSRCVVRRLQLVGRRRRVGRLRPAADDLARAPPVSRCAADLVRLHATDGARASRARFRPPRRCAASRCARFPTIAHSRLPAYTEYFKDGDAVPTQLCELHSGQLQAAAERAIREPWVRSAEAPWDLQVARLHVLVVRHDPLMSSVSRRKSGEGRSPTTAAVRERSVSRGFQAV
jgi:hypothetical protein